MQNIQSWTPDQKRQQISELLRNKGIICRDYLLSGSCPRSPMCPYMHIRNGETRPVPWSVCTFFNQGVCLRDRCTFFHGTQQQLDDLHASRAEVYRPQDYMTIAVPPADYLNPDGSIATTNIPAVTPPAARSQRQPPPPAQRTPQQSVVDPRFKPPPPPASVPGQASAPYQQVMVLQTASQTMPSPLMNTPAMAPFQYQYIQSSPLASFAHQSASLNAFPVQQAPQAPPGNYFQTQPNGNPVFFQIQ